MKNKLISVISILLCAAILTGCSLLPNTPSETTASTEKSTDKMPAATAPRETADASVTGTSETVPETDAPLRFSKEPLELEVSAGQAFVYNLNTNEFLYMKGEGETLAPASTTKLLTIVYALTLLSPDELVTPGDELSMMGEFSTYAYVRSQHTLTVEMLIEGMLLPSGNDAALVVAAAAGRKLSDDENISGVDAVGLFMEGMNEYANSIGMKSSSFIRPDGYPTEGHYTTAEDMAVIAAIAAKNSIITKYARMHRDDVTYASGHVNTWENTNKLLDQSGPFYSAYATGLKTGSADDDDYCLIATADIEGVTYIIGVFSEKVANDRYVDALAIIAALEARL